MTTLEAVRLMCRAIGEDHPSALETGQATLAGDAETLLDQHTQTILNGYDWAVRLSTHRLTISATSPSGFFAHGESLKQDTSLATGRYIGMDNQTGSTVYLYLQATTTSPAWDGTNVVRGQTSSAVRTPSAVTTIAPDSTPAFTTLPHLLQMYVARAAAVEFQKWRKSGMEDDVSAKELLRASRALALRQDSDWRAFTMRDTADGRAAAGRISYWDDRD